VVSQSYAMASRTSPYPVPGLVPGIHVFERPNKDVGGRDKPGHGDFETRRGQLRYVLCETCCLRGKALFCCALGARMTQSFGCEAACWRVSSKKALPGSG